MASFLSGTSRINSVKSIGGADKLEFQIGEILLSSKPWKEKTLFDVCG
jgi:hypothetical protein